VHEQQVREDRHSRKTQNAQVFCGNIVRVRLGNMDGGEIGLQTRR